MKSLARLPLFLLPVLALMFALSACTLKATFKSTTDAFTNFSSSTSAKSWITGEGLLREDHRVTVFVRDNYENLADELAKGRGEYVASLGILLGVTKDREAAFYSFTQAKYPVLVPAINTTPDELLVALHRELAADPILNDTTLDR